ncbi:unnamed protein product, partial [Adineta steineri]
AVASVANAPMNNTLLNAAYNIWQEYEPETFPGSTQVNSYALFIFDATWLLIQSLQQLCSFNKNNSLSCISFIGSSCCFNHYFSNSNLLFNIITNMSFIGVSGESLSIPTGNAQLNGITLRIGVIPSDPFTMVKIVIDQYGQNQTQLTGYCMDLISLLQANLGFIPNIQLAPSGVTYDELM